MKPSPPLPPRSRQDTPLHAFDQRPKRFRAFTSASAQGDLFVGDAHAFLLGLPDASAQIVFLDPPFNLGKTYSEADHNMDRKSDFDYHTWLTSILVESARVLRPGGVLYLYHVPLWAMRLGAFLHNLLTFRHWIAVSMKNSFARGRRLYPAHYALLMFSKGEPSHFQRPKLRPQVCRHCGKMIKDYGGYLPIIQSRGINLSDVWDDLSPVRHASRKHRVANELPKTLFERAVAISAHPGGLYVDPFCGSGSGVVAALEARMRFAACDLVASNCSIVARRIAPFISRQA